MVSDYGILYIDDELKSLKYFEAIFGELAPIYLANTPKEGYELFCQHHSKIGLVLSDEKMPGESGLSLLARIREVNSSPLRILVTAYADLDVAVDALNDRLLYSYLTKPWDPNELEDRLIKALQHFDSERERERLIHENDEVVQQILIADKAASIGTLSTGLNHHMRNALTVMQTFHELLPYQLDDEIGGKPKDEMYWEELYNQVGGQIDHMISILTTLSEGASISQLNLVGGIDLASVLRSAGEEIVKDNPEIEVKIEAANDLPTITGDPEKLGKMARLLFEERCSSFSDCGEIVIEIIQNSAGMLETTFIDNGPPIPDEELARLFDPFYVRLEQPDELGTKLTICYLTVFYHGGMIRAERTNDGRNAVVFTLPVSTAVDEKGFALGRSPRALQKLADFGQRDRDTRSMVFTS